MNAKLTMALKNIWLTVFCLLGLVWASAAEGARPPQEESAPPPSRLDGGELLNLDWRVYIAAKPIYCILVEKDRQRLRVLRHDGRIQVVAEAAAATGENPGPKEKEGDGKTPEGVYFIIKGYLDRRLSVFGTRAFHLNYPNYFDLREGRAGNGIYIHGTNKTLRFNSSNGCVTLKNHDLDRLADLLVVGTPVFIVQSLDSMQEDKGSSPNLSERNFAGAKALLLPEVTAAAANFASLYLIRVNGQTVAVGEYWADQGSAPPQLTVAYLQSGAENRWSVVDRWPAASGQEEAGVAATIEGLPLDLRLQAASLEVDGSSWPEDESLPWQVSLDDLYRSWYQEASDSGPPSLLVPAGLDPSLASLRGQQAGPRKGLVYGLFFLASGISIGSALVVIRRQIRRQGDDLWRLAAPDGEGVHEALRPEEQVAVLRDEVKQAMGVLRTVHKRIDEEAMNVETLEALQARMKALEGAFQGKQEELEQLSAEQAAIKQQGMAENSDHVEALGILQQELAEVKRQLEATRHDMVTVAEREGLVHDQVAELRVLLEREVLSQDDAELKEIVAVCEGVRGQVQAMVESLQRAETTRLHDREEGGRAEAVAEALHGYAAELKGLHSEMAALRGAADTSGLEVVLQGLRDELRQEQASKLELMERLGRLSRLEEALTGERRQHEAQQKESEARQTELTVEKMALESSLAALRQELVQEQGVRSGLASRLVRLEELDVELERRDREHEALRKANTERLAELESLIAALRAELDQEQGARSELESRLERMDELESEKVALKVALDSLRDELSEAQAAQSDLLSRLAMFHELEQELARRDREYESLRKAGEERQAELESAKIALESSLAALRVELSQEQGVRSEVESRLQRLEELELELAQREREHEALRKAGEEHYAEMESEKAGLKLALDSLRHELSEEQGARSDLASKLVRINELEEELSTQIRQYEAVQKASEERGIEAVVERERLGSALESLRNGLREEQAAKFDLERRLARMSDLEQELGDRGREIEDLRKASEDRNLEAALEQERLESALESLRNDLRHEQTLQLELENRLSRISELEDEAEGWCREIEALREAKTAISSAAEAEKDRFDASVAELVLARQVEVASLTSALQEAKDRALAEQENVARLSHQVETLQEALQQSVGQQTQEQANARAGLQQEIVALKGMVAELEKKAAVADGVVMIKGSHYLPGDVLRKWIGKEQ